MTNIMKTLSKFLIPLLLGLMAAACAKVEPVTRQELLNFANAEQNVIAIVNYSEVLASAGEYADLAGFDQRDLAIIKVLNSVEGLDFDNMLLMGGDKKAIILPITDGDAVRASLTKEYDMDEGHGITLYSPPGKGKCMATDGRLLWIVPRGSVRETSLYMDELRAASKESPLTEKVRAFLDENAAKTMAMFINGLPSPSDKSQKLYLTATAQLQGSGVSITLGQTDSKGNPEPLYRSEREADVSSIIAQVNPADMLAAVLVIPADVDWLSLLETVMPYEAREIRRNPLLNQLVRGFDGRVAFSGTMVDPASTDFENPRNYSATLAIGCKPQLVDSVFETFGAIVGSGVPVERRGDAFYLMDGPNPALRIYHDVNCIYVDTPNTPTRGNLSADRLEGAMLWMAVNVPRNFAPLKYIGMETGFKMEGRVKPDVIEIRAEFTDTDELFIANVLKIIKTIG